MKSSNNKTSCVDLICRKYFTFNKSLIVLNKVLLQTCRGEDISGIRNSRQLFKKMETYVVDYDDDNNNDNAKQSNNNNFKKR